MFGRLDLNELMTQNIKPSVYIGDTITLHAENSSEGISDGKIEWLFSDEATKSLYYIFNNDDSLTITCVSTEMESIQVTANCEGESATVILCPRAYQ